MIKKVNFKYKKMILEPIAMLLETYYNAIVNLFNINCGISLLFLI